MPVSAAEQFWRAIDDAYVYWLRHVDPDPDVVTGDESRDFVRAIANRFTIVVSFPDDDTVSVGDHQPPVELHEYDSTRDTRDHLVQSGDAKQRIHEAIYTGTWLEHRSPVDAGSRRSFYALSAADAAARDYRPFNG